MQLEKGRNDENYSYIKLLHQHHGTNQSSTEYHPHYHEHDVMTASLPVYPEHYITNLPGNDSGYEVPISYQDQPDQESIYDEIEEVYEDVQETKT